MKFLEGITPRKYQEEIYKTCIEKNCLVVLPTGLGKTLISLVLTKKIWQTADIIFSTPQCVANDLKKGLYNLNNVCLLIQDEAHRCVKNYDYNFVAQKYKNQAINQRIIGLTASPGSDTAQIKQICKNLSIEEVELRTRESGDVKEYLQELEFEKVMLDF